MIFEPNIFIFIFIFLIRRYGFNEAYSGVFGHLTSDLNDIIECPAPDHYIPTQRKIERMQAEDRKFDAEHYMCDQSSDEQIRACMEFKPWFLADPASIQFSDADRVSKF
jgi:hypothetical protein